MQYVIEFSVDGKRRSVVITDGSRICRPLPNPCMTRPAAIAVWEAIKDMPGIVMHSPPPQPDLALASPFGEFIESNVADVGDL